MTPHKDIIRASEIAQYTYCARAWWLGRVQGHRSENLEAMRAGTARHRAHGRVVRGYQVLRSGALALLVLAALLLVAWLLLTAVG
jgi:CRISPR/Cas system-associated exonuclease Cas4 (RecB family)